MDWLTVNRGVRQQVHADSTDPLDLAQCLCLAQGLCGSPWQQQGHDPLAPLTELHSLIVICELNGLDWTGPDRTREVWLAEPDATVLCFSHSS